MKADKNHGEKKIGDTIPLKKLYPDAAQRIKLREEKIASLNVKAPNPVFIRLQPHQSSKLQNKSYLTMIIGGKSTIAQVNALAWKKMALKQDESLFLFIDKKLVPNGQQVSKIHQKYKDEDGILYLMYAEWPTF